jgi:fused signal recognition particle receptor
VPVSGTILTKADADAKGGAAISIAHITGKPILFLGVGQEYKDLKKFETQWFIDRLFER